MLLQQLAARWGFYVNCSTHPRETSQDLPGHRPQRKPCSCVPRVYLGLLFSGDSAYGWNVQRKKSFKKLIYFRVVRTLYPLNTCLAVQYLLLTTDTGFHSRVLELTHLGHLKGHARGQQLSGSLAPAAGPRQSSLIL